MNQIEQLRQTAKGVWPHLLPMMNTVVGDTIRFYRAAVVQNPGHGELSVQREAGPVVTVPCSSGLTGAVVGDEVLVLTLGTDPGRYQVAVCGADPSDFASTIVDPSGGGGGSGGGITQDDLDDALDEQEAAWKEQYNALYQLIMATAGEVFPIQEGHLIDTVTVLYYLSDSRIELTGGQWQYGAPEVESGKYLWTKLYITYSDGYPATETEPICITAPGTWRVLSVLQLFLASPNGDQLLSDELEPDRWTTTAPVLGDSQYLWTRQRIAYTEDGTSEVSVSYTEPYCLSGVIGDLAEQKISDYKIILDDQTYSFQELAVLFKNGYVAQSDFGTYLRELVNKFSMTEEGMEQDFTFFSDLKANLLALNSAFEDYKIGVEAYIRTGIVDYEDGVPVFGLAVGKDLVTSVTADGDTVIEKKNFRALYTEKELSFWIDGAKVAYMSGNQLYITNVVALASLRVGSWSVKDEGSAGLVFKWIGG